MRVFPLRPSFVRPVAGRVEVRDEGLFVATPWTGTLFPWSEVAWTRRERSPWWLFVPGDVARVHLRRGRFTLLAMIPPRRDLYLAARDVDGLIAAIASTA